MLHSGGRERPDCVGAVYLGLHRPPHQSRHFAELWAATARAGWAALGPQNNEKRPLMLEDVETRFRRSEGVFGTY